MSSSAFSDFIHRVRSRTSLERLRPSPSDRPLFERKRSGSIYSSYSVHQQDMAPTILRSEDASRKVLEFVIDMPGGKRALSKLGRTCKAFFEPAMNVLWKDLDSLVPIIGLFPSHLLRRAKRPGLGLAKNPVEEDWSKVLTYGERVKKLTYQESFNNVSPSIFPIIDEFRPRPFILPNLETLVWRCETPAGLERSLLFVSPSLGHLVLEVGMRVPRFEAVIAEIAKRAKLRSLTIASPTCLPDNFTEVMRAQDKLEKLALTVPGALSAGVGRWIASLPRLRSLQLDLTARSVAAIEGFFEETGLRSGYSTPASIGGTDSGVFSGGEEIDFAHDVRKGLRKSALRVTGDHPSRVSRTGAGGALAQLEELQLNGSAGNVAAFLRHLRSEQLVTLELAIEDPPDESDWQDLCTVLCDRFGDSLQTLRITATASSRPELVRVSSRGDVSATARPLSLKYLSSLPRLMRLDIDLPTSVVFSGGDIEHLAAACPNVEVLKLCPTARFPLASGPPGLTMEGLAPLMGGCPRLHTLAIVLNAYEGSQHILGARAVSSGSLVRLNVGHSWVKDPLKATILLSQLAPHLETLKFFHEPNRPGYVAAHANAWQKVAEFLPHIQQVRLMERRAVAEEIERYEAERPFSLPEPEPESVVKRGLESIMESELEPEPNAQPEPELKPEQEYVMVVEKVDKEVDATMAMVEPTVVAEPETLEVGVQSEPEISKEGVQLPEIPEEDVQPEPESLAESVQSEPEVIAIPLAAMPELASVAVAASREDEDEDAYILGEAYMFPVPEPSIKDSDSSNTESTSSVASSSPSEATARRSVLHYVPSVGGVVSSARSMFLAYPLFLSLLFIQSSLGMLGARRVLVQQPVQEKGQEQEKMMVPSEDEEEDEDEEQSLPPLVPEAMGAVHQSISPVCQ